MLPSFLSASGGMPDESVERRKEDLERERRGGLRERRTWSERGQEDVERQNYKHSLPEGEGGQQKRGERQLAGGQQKKRGER